MKNLLLIGAMLLMLGCEVRARLPVPVSTPGVSVTATPHNHYDNHYYDDYYYDDDYYDYCAGDCCYYYDYYDVSYSYYEVCEVVECYDSWTEYYEFVEETCWYE